MNLIKRLFIYLDERFSKLSVTSLRAQYYVILIGHCRFRYIFSRCIYCDDVPWPISVLLPSRYQRTIDFIVSFYGHLPIYPPALFIYLHTRTDCDQCCVVVLIYVLAIDLFRRCLFTHVRMFIQPTLCCDKRGEWSTVLLHHDRFSTQSYFGVFWDIHTRYDTAKLEIFIGTIASPIISASASIIGETSFWK